MAVEKQGPGGLQSLQLKLLPLAVEHIEQVLEIEMVSFGTPWSRQAFEMEISENEFANYVVAVDGDIVIGYGGVWVILDEGHITNVAVHPSYRGLGLGRLLMLELMRRSYLAGAGRMTLEVRVSNQVARKLYQGLGFKERGIRRKYYSDNQEDALIMWNNKIKKYLVEGGEGW